MRRQLASALIVGVFAVLAVGSTDGDSSSSERAPAKRISRPPAPKATNTHFAHGNINVRTGPGQNHRIARTLDRGDTLSLAEPDEKGWARILGRDSGYVYTRLNLVRTDRPAQVPTYAGTCAEEMRQVHLRMNRAPDAVKEFSEAGLREVTWWYREKPRDRYPTHQFSFLTGPYTEGCRTSEIENGGTAS